MAVELGLKKAADCHWDALSLGEIMLRLDPGEGRIRTTRHFAAWEGGGEYNVVRGLRKVFGMRTGAITALVDNEVGHLVEDFMMQGGVDTSLINFGLMALAGVIAGSFVWNIASGRFRIEVFAGKADLIRHAIGAAFMAVASVRKLPSASVDRPVMP